MNKKWALPFEKGQLDSDLHLLLHRYIHKYIPENEQRYIDFVYRCERESYFTLFNDLVAFIDELVAGYAKVRTRLGEQK